MVSFLKLLGMLEIVSAYGHRIPQFDSKLIYKFWLGTEFNVSFVRDARMVAAVEFKWSMTGARVICIIIHKFGYWEESEPIILLIVHKSSKIGLHDTALLLYLAISLQIEGGWESLLDSKEIAEWWPKLWGENRATITHNWVG